MCRNPQKARVFENWRTAHEVSLLLFAKTTQEVAVLGVDGLQLHEMGWGKSSNSLFVLFASFVVTIFPRPADFIAAAP